MSEKAKTIKRKGKNKNKLIKKNYTAVIRNVCRMPPPTRASEREPHDLDG